VCVCLSVCPCVRSRSHSGTTCPIFANFSACYLRPWLRSLLLALRYAMYVLPVLQVTSYLHVWPRICDAKRRLLRGSQRGQQNLTLRRIPKLTHQWAAADIYDCLGTTVTSYTGSKRTWKTTQINEKLKKTIDVKKSSNKNFKNVIKRKKT